MAEETKKASQGTAAAPKQEQYEEFSGDTENVLVPSLAADFWIDGRIISGTLEGYREVKFTDKVTKQQRTGNAYRIRLNEPIRIGDVDAEIVEMPPLTGFTAALKDVKQQYRDYTPKIGDILMIECTGYRRSKQEGFSDSPNFRIKFRRKKF